MQTIIPSLWFDNNCVEAMNFYVAVFPNSKIISTTYYPENLDEPHMTGMQGKVLNGEFELNGQRFIALDGGPIFKFNEAISLTIPCKDQAEIDHYWEALSAVPESEQCGWVKDKYGLSWQIIPANMGELLKTNNAMAAMLKMKKIVIAELEAANKE